MQNKTIKKLQEDLFPVVVGMRGIELVLEVIYVDS